ncbi:hypothetical protein HPB47_024451 [Ixodes persulcatus]|uniref:Uncharacterized protein n=1 Tax=Ixodes persulcatus TaxID=34615 RepID=A0AC60Q4A0_IXOPE|nr:hypothetical protein HPB47_024451 [Ixodes persulcatus]
MEQVGARVSKGGIYYFQMTDYYVAVLALIIISFLELCALGWFYGGHNLLSGQSEVMHHVPYIYLRICWGLITPLVFVAVVVCGGMSLSRLRYRNKHHFPMWVDIVGWILFGIIVSVVPVFVVKALHKAESSGIIQPLVVINNPKNGVNHHTSVLKSHRYKKGYSKGDYQGETVI